MAIPLPSLLDVNCLIALVDSDHVAHESMKRWFSKNEKLGWATCPLTENGMVRILSHPAYPSGRRTPAEAIQILTALRVAFAHSHQFWSDDVTLTDEELFNVPLIAGAKQVTDVYLLGLAARRQARLVSYDRSLVWQAINGGTAKLVHLLVS